MSKKITTLIIIIFCLLILKNTHATGIAYNPKGLKISTNKYSDSLMFNIANLSIKDFEKVTGRHLKFKEKLSFKLLQYNLKLTGKKKLSTTEEDPKIEKKALWSKWLGIGSLIGLLIPGISLLCLPAAIVAIVLGATTVKKTKNPKYSRQGIIFGIITLSLLLLLGLLVFLITFMSVR